MKTTEREIQPGDDYLSIVAETLGVSKRDMRILPPVEEYVSIASENGIAIGFRGPKKGLLVLLPFETILDFIETLKAAIKDMEQ